MEAVYIKNDKSLNYFIFGYNKKFGKDAGEILLKDIYTVNEKAFVGNGSLKRIFLKILLELLEKKRLKTVSN